VTWLRQRHGRVLRRAHGRRPVAHHRRSGVRRGRLGGNRRCDARRTARSVLGGQPRPGRRAGDPVRSGHPCPPEGIAGAVTFAVAASLAARSRGSTVPTRSEFLQAVVEFVPSSKVRDSIVTAAGQGPTRLRSRAVGQRYVSRPPPCRSPCGARRAISTTTNKPCGQPSLDGVTSTQRARSEVGSSRRGLASTGFPLHGGSCASHFRTGCHHRPAKAIAVDIPAPTHLCTK
jgi:hypothetical protein